MKKSKILILKSTVQPRPQETDTLIISFNDLKKWLKSGRFFMEVFHYQEATLFTYRLAVLPQPFILAIIIRLLAWRRVFFLDDFGERQEINIRYLLACLLNLVKNAFSISSLLKSTSNEVSTLFNFIKTKSVFSQGNFKARPVYLRTDLWFGVRSGGSVGHIAGVLNNLEQFSGKPILLTTDTIPTVRFDLEKTMILPDSLYRDYQELPKFSFNKVFYEKSLEYLNKTKISFIYQRYSLGNFCGVKLATYYKVPFILEYNGSEIWIARNWGKPLKYEQLYEKIELLNLQAADLIVVVSQPMKDELVVRGIETDKILVNPNGVDPDRYSPEVNGSQIRKQYGFDEDKIVIGFIGTFGLWHGAEVLAEAFGKLLQKFPEYQQRVSLLMIGEGLTLPQVQENLEKYGVEDACIMTGLISQEDGPIHLAACDILASPHVPNSDGTPFFGSPTKLFEYMAMGKGIVASNLDQIGEILKHEETACMVEPGDSTSLMLGLKTLIDNPKLRDKLGQAAQKTVLQHHTWRKHTQNIIDKLKECCV